MAIQPGIGPGVDPTRFPQSVVPTVDEDGSLYWGDVNLLGVDHPCQAQGCGLTPNPNYLIDPRAPSFPMGRWAAQLRDVFSWLTREEAICEVRDCLASARLMAIPEEVYLEDETLLAWQELEVVAEKRRQAVLKGFCAGPAVPLPECSKLWTCAREDAVQQVTWEGNAVMGLALPAVGGVLGTQLELTFSSANSSVASEFGQGWTSNWSWRVTLGSGSVKLTTGNGTELIYMGSPAVGSLYTAPAGAESSLKRLASGWEEILQRGGRRVYDSSGRLVYAQNSQGTWTLTYSGGLLVKVQDPISRLTTLTYSSGKLSQVQDGAGRTNQFTIDGSGNLASYTSPELCITSLSYDASHRLTGWITPDNVATSYVYDGSHRLTEVIGADNTSAALANRPRTTFSYSTDQVVMTNARGYPTTYLLDSNWQLSERIRVDGARTTYTWDANNWPQTITGPDGQVMTFYYRALNSDPSLVTLAGVQSATGSVIYQFDANDRLEAIVYSDGSRASFTWDSERLRSYQSPVGLVTTYSYTATRKQLESAQYPGGSRTTVGYSSAGRVQAVTDRVGQRTTISYDAAGYRQVVQNPLNQRTTYQRDDVNRVLSLENTYGNRVSFTYVAGTTRPQTVVDAGGGTTTLSYNLAGRLSEVLSATGSRTTLQYDALGHWTSQWDGAGQLTTYGYDRMNRLEAVITPLGGRSTTVYDAAGRVLARVSSRGGITTHVYDESNGRLLAVQDPLGVLTSYGYDSAGRLTEVQDGLGYVTTSVFDAAGRLTERINPLGQITTQVWDSAWDRVQETINARGYVTTYGYDAANRMVSVLNPLGNRATVVYDVAGKRQAELNPLGQVTTYGYDAVGRPTSVQNGMGEVATTVYDAGGRVWATVNGLGQRTTNTYDAAGRVTEVKNPLGQVTTTQYDGLDRVVSVMNPLGYRTTTTYARYSPYVSVTDPLGRITTQVLDTSGQQIGLANPLNERTTTSYDVAGRVRDVQNPRGYRSTTLYDSLSRVEATLDALGYRTTVSYDGAGREKTRQDALGRVTTFSYDQVGQLEATQDMLGNRTTQVYDPAGQLWAVVSPLGQRSTSSYDRAGRLEAAVNPLGQRTTLGYDAAGRRRETQDARGYRTTQVYDAAGRVMAVIDALGNRTTTQYDAAGRVERLVNARGAVKTLTYDAAGRNTTEKDPLGRVTTLSYDAAGQLSEKFDARGVRVTYGYDLAGRVNRRGYPSDLTTTIVYDPAGNPTQIQDAVGTWSYQYDALHGLSAQADPMLQRVSYSYNGAGQRTQLQTGAGTFDYGYDAAGRLWTLVNPQGERTTYTYDAAGRELKKQLGNSAVASTVYDAAGRVTRRAHETAAGTSLQNFDYQYDAAGNRTQVTESGGRTVAWAYDALNRLASEIRSGSPAHAHTFTYDAVGNRTVQRKDGTYTTYTYDLADQLTRSVTNAATTMYSYDAAGNQTLQVVPGNQRTTYSWNDENRQTRVQAAGGVDLQARYRHDGLRYETVAGGTTTRFVFDGVNYLLETSAAGVVQVAYTVEPQPYGEVLARRASAASRFYHLDALGSVRLLTNSAQSSTDTYIYSAWGEPVSSVGSTTNPFRWVGGPGYYYDTLTGLYYVRARIYAPVIARWLSQDRLQRERSSQPYRYVENLPSALIDPTGLATWVEEAEENPNDPPGTFDVRRYRCSEEYNNCCCVGIGVSYRPTRVEQVVYTRIYLRTYVKQLSRFHFPCLTSYWANWHFDRPKDDQDDWPANLTGPKWEDFPGGGPPEGMSVRMEGCPSLCELKSIEMDWEVCAIGEAWGKTNVIGCVRYGWDCSLTYHTWGHSVGGCGCIVGCKKTWRGAAGDGITPSPPKDSPS